MIQQSAYLEMATPVILLMQTLADVTRTCTENALATKFKQMRFDYVCHETVTITRRV
jgi:hypothetical protein